MTERPRHLHAVEPGERAPESGPGEEWRDLEEIFQDAAPVAERERGGHLRTVLNEKPRD